MKIELDGDKMLTEIFELDEVFPDILGRVSATGNLPYKKLIS